MSDAAFKETTRSTSVFSDAVWRGVVVAFAVNGLLFGAWAARVPAFRDKLAFDPGTLGMLLLALACGAIAAFPFADALSEKWGADGLSVRCAWWYGPALIAPVLAPNPFVLEILLFLFGAIMVRCM